MKSTLISFSMIFLYILVSPSVSFSVQDSKNVQVHRIELKDGSVVIGTILSEDSESVKFRTLSNIEMVIQRDQILEMEIISDKIVKGELWIKDPNRTRLLFAPTGRALNAGQGYFSTYEIFFPFFAYGVTDFFSIAGGMTLIPGAEEQLLYFAPKITPLQTKYFNLAAGALFIKVPDEEEGAGIVYGVSTYGKEDLAVTLGIGFGFSGGDFASNTIITVGGEVQISKSMKLITENWIIPNNDVHLISLGVRFFGKSLAADLGLIYPAGSEPNGFPFIPWVGFAYNFGPKM